MSVYFQSIPEGKDPELWRLAQKRASFKRHLATYLTVNIFLWLLWALPGDTTYDSGLPWPLWASFGWGIGLTFHYRGAYVKTNRVQKEYEKLIQDQSKL